MCYCSIALSQNELAVSTLQLLGGGRQLYDHNDAVWEHHCPLCACVRGRELNGHGYIVRRWG